MPEAVKKAAAEVDELIRRNKEAAQNGDLAQSVVPDNEELDIASSEGDDTPVAEVHAFEAPVQDDSASTPADGDIGARLAQLESERDKADQRWRSLQGQINSKDKQIEQLQTLLANLSAAPPEPAAEPTPEQPLGHTAADEDAFGADMIDVMQRVARQIARSEVQTLRDEVAGLTQTVAGHSEVVRTTAQATFDDKLTKHFGSEGWKTLDKDAGFHEWLDETPSRRAIFATLAQQQDAVGVADMFKQYTLLHSASSAPDDKKRQQLEKQVAPGKSRNVQTSDQSKPEEKHWTRSEIANFYASWKRREISAEEYAATEKLIQKAMKTQRVDYSK